MRTVALSALVAICTLSACPALAQTGSYVPTAPFTASQQQRSTAPGEGETWRTVGSTGLNDPFGPGLSAVQTGDLAKAEKFFAHKARKNRRSGEANFYLGAVRMDLGKWDAARKNLEIAVNRMPRHPDPKSRLGVTYAMLGDIASANAQRAELVRMAVDCKDACKLSAYISKGIRMIDEALAQSSQD
jgi:TolA-binding protein